MVASLVRLIAGTGTLPRCKPGARRRHCADAATLEPIRQALQVTSEGAEASDRLTVPIRSNGCDMHAGANIDRCRIRMCNGNVPLRTGALRLCHAISSVVSGRAGLRKVINFLTGIAAMASPLSSAQRPMGHVFLSESSLPKIYRPLPFRKRS